MERVREGLGDPVREVELAAIGEGHVLATVIRVNCSVVLANEGARAAYEVLGHQATPVFGLL